MRAQAAPLTALVVTLLCLGLVFSRLGDSTVAALAATQPFAVFAADAPATSAWAEVPLHDLRTMVNLNVISFEAFRAEMVSHATPRPRPEGVARAAAAPAPRALNSLRARRARPPPCYAAVRAGAADALDNEPC
jgi:hypothetical protein